MSKSKVIYTCFPGGRHKALTMSYDDGREEDRRLVDIMNKSGIRGTFNLNSGLPAGDGRIPLSEAASLYAGHEIACHTSLQFTAAGDRVYNPSACSVWLEVDGEKVQAVSGKLTEL